MNGHLISLTGKGYIDFKDYQSIYTDKNYVSQGGGRDFPQRDSRGMGTLDQSEDGDRRKLLKR